MANQSLNYAIDSDQSDWSSAEEIDDEEQLLTICLFCDQTFKSVDVCLTHLNQHHNFNLIELCRLNKFDCIKYIKLINYIRECKPNIESVPKIVQDNLFDDEIYLKPFDADDSFLTFDIESQYPVESYESSRIDELRNRMTNDELAKELAESLEREKMLLKEISLLKESVKNLFSEDDKIEKSKSIAGLSINDDTIYVSSYSDISIHHEMLNDKIRTEAYQRAILENSHVFKDKTVLDVGCGTGILSLFAAKAGAKLVVAVDQSAIIDYAMDIVRENGFAQTIICIKNKVESINFKSLNLPDKFDVIISEWMGYFLVFEGMLDSVIFCRDHLLQTNGLLLPNRCTLSIAGCCDPHFHNYYFKSWDNVYDCKMTCIKNQAKILPIIETVDPKLISTNVITIKEFDINKCTMEEAQTVSSSFEFICNDDQPISCLVGWFDCFFDEESYKTKVKISTSPFSQATHWKQMILLLEEPLTIGKGNILNGKIIISRIKNDLRCLEIVLNLLDKEYVYYLT